MRTKKCPHRAEPPAGAQTPMTPLINNGPTITRLRGRLRKALREFEQGFQAKKYRSSRGKAWSREKILAALKAESLQSRNIAPKDEVFDYESVTPTPLNQKGAEK